MKQPIKKPLLNPLFKSVKKEWRYGKVFTLGRVGNKFEKH